MFGKEVQFIKIKGDLGTNDEDILNKEIKVIFTINLVLILK